jgi:Phage stabilisation protein.
MGQAEADPDPLKSLVKIRNEAYVINRHTTEVFDNIGTTGFPFQRIEGAQIMVGTFGPHTACEFVGAVAMLGSGRNQAPRSLACPRMDKRPRSARWTLT